MEKKRVSVQIEGRSYSLITTDDEKYVQKVANEVLSHIRKAAQSTKQLDTRDCAVFAALNFCDDRNKALKKNKDYVEKADKIIQQTNDLNRLCKEYREKLTEAMNDNTRLINNNKELEKRLAVLGHEVSQLKEKLESVEKGKEKAESEKSEPEKNSVPKEKKASDAKNNMTEQSDDIPVNVLSNEAKKTEQELRNEKLLGYVPMTQFSLFDEDKK
nr:cell division protein ZapA [Ruminococcus bromii]